MEVSRECGRMREPKSYESSRASEYATVDGPSTSVTEVAKPHSTLSSPKSVVAAAREVAAAVVAAALVAAAPLDPPLAHPTTYVVAVAS